MKIFLTVAFVLNVLFCQSQVKTYFLKGATFSETHLYSIVSSADSADYFRTIARGKNNEGLYDVNEYYPDKSIRRTGTSLTNSIIPKYDGNVICYYKNGNKASEELFVSGKQKGISTYYFANKQLKERTLFGSDKSKQIEKVLELNDSLGNRLLDVSGTGNFKLTDELGNLIEGSYANGLKDKSWKTINTTSRETYFDEYNLGEYISGKTLDANGKKIEYDKLETSPSFNGGNSAFGSFLRRNLRYPPMARDAGVQGKVTLQFVIEKDGSVADAKVINGVGSGCDEEALRVINNSPKWNPGMHRGLPITVSYVVPVYFKLSPSATKKSTEKRSSSDPYGF